MKITVKDTNGIGNVIAEEAELSDLSTLLGVAQLRGAVGISVHCPGCVGVYLTSQEEVQKFIKGMAGSFREENVKLNFQGVEFDFFSTEGGDSIGITITPDHDKESSVDVFVDKATLSLYGETSGELRLLVDNLHKELHAEVPDYDRIEWLRKEIAN
jgi:hypothetical protein